MWKGLTLSYPIALLCNSGTAGEPQRLFGGWWETMPNKACSWVLPNAAEPVRAGLSISYLTKGKQNDQDQHG